MTGGDVVVLGLVLVVFVVATFLVVRGWMGQRSTSTTPHYVPGRHTKALKRRWAREDKRYTTIGLVLSIIVAAIFVAAPASGALNWVLEHGESILLIVIFPAALIGLMQKLEGVEIPYWLSFWSAVCCFFYGIYTLF